MPIPEDAKRLLRLVEHDGEVLRLLSSAANSESADVSDWQTTILFYAAASYVRALAACRGKTFNDHVSVRDWLLDGDDLDVVSLPYRKLQGRSREARYDGRTFSGTEMDEHQRWFEEVMSNTVRLLKAEGAVKPPRVFPEELLDP